MIVGCIFLSSDARAELEEVLVTSQKIEQNVLDVPGTVEVLDSKIIQDLGIKNIDSFYQLIPGLSSAPIAGDNTGVRLFIRGIGSTDALIGQDPAVSVYRDGIYQSRGQALNVDYADIERVEVLKGPNGTLYGRNTLGGAINIVSRRASTDEVYGNINLGTGSYSQRSGQALINIPFSSNFAFKLAAFSDAQNGWVENQSDSPDFSARDRKGFRLDLAYDTQDSLRIDLSVERSSVQDSGYYYQPIPSDLSTGLNPTLVAANAYQPFSNERLDEVNGSNRNNNADSLINSVKIAWDFAEAHTFKFLAGHSNSSSRSYINFDNAYDQAALTGVLTGLINGRPESPGTNDAIAGYNQAVLGYNMLAGGVNDQFLSIVALRDPYKLHKTISLLEPYNPQTHGQAVYGLSTDRGRPFDNNSLSLEFQFDGASSSEQVRYVAGLYFFRESSDYAQYVGQNDFLEWVGGIDLAWAAQAGAVLPDLGEALAAAGAELLAAEAASLETPPDFITAQARSTAALPYLTTASTLLETIARPDGNLILEGASLSAEFASKASSVAGYANISYIPSESWDFAFGLRTTFDNREINTAHFDPLGGAFNPDYSHDLNTSFSGANYMLMARYRPTKNSNIYLSINTSYRAGGFNETYTTTNPDELLFDDERITGYEFGYKAQFGNRLRLTTAVFFYQLKDLQYAIFNPVNPAQRSTVNTDGTVVGFDFSMIVAITQYWQITLSYANLERDTDPYQNPFSNQIDYPVSVQSPHNSANLSIDGVVPFASLYEMHIRIGLDYASDTNILEGISQAAHVLARLDLNFLLDDFILNIWSRNLTNTSYIIDGIPFASVSGSGPDLVIFGQPRSLGVNVSYTF